MYAQIMENRWGMKRMKTPYNTAEYTCNWFSATLVDFLYRIGGTLLATGLMGLAGMPRIEGYVFATTCVINDKHKSAHNC